MNDFRKISVGQVGRSPAHAAIAGARAFQRMQSKELVGEREHFLAKYADLLEANPRAMKRLLNAYGFRRGFDIQSPHRSDPDSLVRWTILENRRPPRRAISRARRRRDHRRLDERLRSPGCGKRADMGQAPHDRGRTDPTPGLTTPAKQALVERVHRAADLLAYQKVKIWENLVLSIG